MNNFELDVLAYLSRSPTSNLERPLKIVQSKEQLKSYPVDKNAVFDEKAISQLKLSDRAIIFEELKKDA